MDEIVGKVKTSLAKMEDTKPYMNEIQWHKFANSYFISMLKYGIQFVLEDNQSVRKKFHTTTNDGGEVDEGE